MSDESVREVCARGPDGVMAGIWEVRWARQLRKAGVPVVDTFNWTREVELPRVLADDVAVGRMAAEHLVERGLRELVFVGDAWAPWASERAAGVQDVVRRESDAEPDAVSTGAGAASTGAGATLDVPDVTRWGDMWWGMSWTDPGAEMVEYLRRARKPLGVVAANDLWGLRVLSSCRAAGIRVPEEVAVIGVDDDELLCQMGRPALTSVMLDTDRIGYEAGRMLDGLMNGELAAGEERVVRVAPVGVNVRLSTDVVAVEDEALAEAVRVMRRQASRGLTVGRLLESVPMTRRGLERRCRDLLGHGPAEEIRRVRVERARQLLRETDAPMSEVARRAGFHGQDRFAKVFKNVTGETPTQYRERMRGKISHR
jgi:LacI family transcriptional regulator